MATWARLAVAVGDFVVLAGETFAAMFRRPFAWRELLDQIWFVARVSIVPTIMLSIPYTVLIVFTLNVVLLDVGAGDLSGAGAALASVAQVGPVVTAIVVSGAGATAMCADLGALTIREEIDAMTVILNVRGVRNIPCETNPVKRAPTVEMSPTTRPPATTSARTASPPPRRTWLRRTGRVGRTC